MLRPLGVAPDAKPELVSLPFSVESTPLVNDLEGSSPSQATSKAAAIVPGGPASRGNLDRDAPEGKSGDGASPEPAVLLFPFASDLTLQDTDLNNLARNQAQRIETAPSRATQEERRASPAASDAFFLASGDVGHKERRKHSSQDSAAGGRMRAAGATAGSVVATPTASTVAASEGEATELASRAAGIAQPGAHGAAEPAQGVLRAHGKAVKRNARVAFARPNVDRGPAATIAEEQDARIRDDMDAELLAARMQRSIVDASVVRGERVAPGRGGRAANDSGTAHSTRGAGASALPYTPGPGVDHVLDTRDGRYIRWFVEQKARVQKGLVFPFARAIAKDQGTSVYRVIVTRSGSLAGPVHLVRSSGYADFDAAARTAIRNAAPFAPLPHELMRDSEQLAILIPIAFANPMVE